MLSTRVVTIELSRAVSSVGAHPQFPIAIIHLPRRTTQSHFEIIKNKRKASSRERLKEAGRQGGRR